MRPFCSVGVTDRDCHGACCVARRDGGRARRGAAARFAAAAARCRHPRRRASAHSGQHCSSGGLRRRPAGCRDQGGRCRGGSGRAGERGSHGDGARSDSCRSCSRRGCWRSARCVDCMRHVISLSSLALGGAELGSELCAPRARSAHARAPPPRKSRPGRTDQACVRALIAARGKRGRGARASRAPRGLELLRSGYSRVL
jgi:hypothetical protein